MEQELFQIYDTDSWESHDDSRRNLGVFSSVQGAIESYLNDKINLIGIFRGDSRLFIEKIFVDKQDGYSRVFDSQDTDDFNYFKKIIFFKSVTNFKDNLNFLDIDDEEIPFDIHSIENVDDVTDFMIEEYLNEDNAIQFIKQSVFGEN